MKSRKFVFTFFKLFSSLISLFSINAFKCGADKLKLNKMHINSTEEEEKRRLAVEYSDIKIGVDYNSFAKPNSMSDENYNKLKSLIEETTKEFSKFLKVQHTDIDITGQLENIKKVCKVESLGNGYNDYLKDNDLFIIPVFNSTLGKDVLASASYCLTHGSRPRPVIGALHITPNLNFDKENANIFIKHLIFHEIIHILAFDPVLLKNLGMTKTSHSITYINSQRVISKARQHFNCTTLTGIALESQKDLGDPGAHWDARYMLGDIMISNDYIDSALSDITLSLLEDTKYYKVNYYSGNLFKFGKNKGCDFFNDKCIINNKLIFEEEFCINPGQSMCSSSKITKGDCRIYDYSNYNITVPKEYQYFNNPNLGGFYSADFCPVADASYSESDYYPGNCKYGKTNHASDYGEIFGNSSFCFLSSLTPSSSIDDITSKPMCYKVECNRETKQIVVYIGSSTFICPTNGGITSGSGYKGILSCPRYYDICGTKTDILCNDIFDCLNKKIEVDENSYIYANGTNNFDRFIYSISSHIQYSYYILFIFITLLL